MNSDLVCKKEEIKCNNIIKQYKNVFFIDYITKEDINQHNPIGQKFLAIHIEY